MARLEWGRIDDKGYTAGVSHGVFFGEDGRGIAWTGLSAVIETPLTNSPETAYDVDNRPYKLLPHTSSKTHKVSCYIYPEEMEDYLGTDSPGDSGIVLSTRPPKTFSMCYRTETSDEDYEYHILFNQLATFGEINHSTITDRPSPTLFDIRISGTPHTHLETDHIIVGSDHPKFATLEKFLIGSETISSNLNSFLSWLLGFVEDVYYPGLYNYYREDLVETPPGSGLYDYHGDLLTEDTENPGLYVIGGV